MSTYWHGYDSCEAFVEARRNAHLQSPLPLWMCFQLPDQFEQYPIGSRVSDLHGRVGIVTEANADARSIIVRFDASAVSPTPEPRT